MSDEKGPIGLDSYAPAQISARVEAAGVAKTQLAMVPLLTLGMLAGAFIAFGAVFFTTVTTGVDAGSGPVKLLGGVAFSLGLILVIVGGAELFTGNALIVMAWAERRITLAALLRNWGVVLAANLVGALGMVVLMAGSGLLEGAHGARAAAIAEAKLALGPVEAFFRGVLCNALVCLAVWLTLAARTATGKILSVLWPIAGFVAMGFEHCVANFYLIPAGMLAGAAGGPAEVLGNLVPVILGNIVGGAGGVAVSYRLAYG